MRLKNHNNVRTILRRSAWYQVPAITILKTLYAILGVATLGASRVLYNEQIWSPTQILIHWHGSGGRFLAFCCAVLWYLAQVSCGISGNSVPFGYDCMSFFPAWINVRRGSIICMLLGMWAIVPWLLVKNASTFIQFMSAYGCFICQTCSIMIADYFLVHRCRLDVPALYNPHGRYRYIYGVNWRAAVVQFALMALFIPGVAHTANPKVHTSTIYQHFYGTNWFINTFSGWLIYWVLCLLFPARETIFPVGDSSVIEGCPSEQEQEAKEEYHVDVFNKDA